MVKVELENGQEIVQVKEILLLTGNNAKIFVKVQIHERIDSNDYYNLFSIYSKNKISNSIPWYYKGNWKGNFPAFNPGQIVGVAFNFIEINFISVLKSNSSCPN